MSAMSTHKTPAPGAECACCFDDIESENYVEYRTGEGKEWLPSLFCEMCVGTLIKRQWQMYEESLAKATCKAQQKRMLGDGPPTHVHDKKALPCPEGESVHSLWFMRDGEIHSALLEGAPQGEARQMWWDEKLAFQFEEDDDDEEEESAATPTKATEESTGVSDTTDPAVDPAVTIEDPTPMIASPAAQDLSFAGSATTPKSPLQKAPKMTPTENLGTPAAISGGEAELLAAGGDSAQLP